MTHERDGELECAICDTPMILIKENHNLNSKKHGSGDIWFCLRCYKPIIFNEYGELIERAGESWRIVSLYRVMKYSGLYKNKKKEE